ncbi:MAG TPA: hypothetical protein VMF91_27675 [Bryobacteraceae bacterium]|nr:hypothetical protein [Bryobacteraceae bacterium]
MIQDSAGNHETPQIQSGNYVRSIGQVLDSIRALEKTVVSLKLPLAVFAPVENSPTVVPVAEAIGGVIVSRVSQQGWLAARIEISPVPNKDRARVVVLSYVGCTELPLDRRRRTFFGPIWKPCR